MKQGFQLYNIAHRGARSLAPENTIPAFHKAWQVGAHGVETDVSVCSDGTLVLLHDDTLTRTTDVGKIFPTRKSHSVSTFTYAELQMLDAGSWFVDTDPFGTLKNGSVSKVESQTFGDARIPMLSELLYYVKKKSWFVNIELKPLPKENRSFAVVENVLSLIEDIGLERQNFSISSFHHPFLRSVEKLRPDVEINALIGDGAIKRQNWGDYEFKIYNANVRKTDSQQITRAQQHGCRVNLYTVNDLDEMRYYLSLGVEKIITDYPQLLSDLKVKRSDPNLPGGNQL
jgi:glycerophosphoryl diester phosphodiesterase